MIKAVAQATPAYAISVFRIPTTICDDIQKAIARFRWGSKKGAEEYALGKVGKTLSGERKKRFGIQGFARFNQALIVKQS